MKCLILVALAASLAVVSGTFVQFSPALYTAAIPITTQYHAQDGLGQYSYGYSGGPSAKAEYKSLDGVTRGSYSYVDADGELQTVEYTADSANGFQASATNLPKAPVDDKVAPKPVEDTPEVAKAKAEHFAAFREAELKAAEDPINGEGNGNDGQDDRSSNGSQEQSGGLSREASSAETESPNGSGEQGSNSSNGNGNGNGNGRGNGKTNGNGNGHGNGSNGITRLTSSGLSTGLTSSLSGLSGLSSLSSYGSLGNSFTSTIGSSITSGLGSDLSLSLLNGNGQTSSSALSGLSSLQLNGDLSSSLSSYSGITPATTSQLRPITLSSVRVPATSYLRVSTPTHGYSIVSPSVLTAVPTLRATSSQTISRTLPISLTSALLR